ncbi:lytic transglycosylase domain-containing protein [Pontimonas sp.]|nr:lytic transglycosylase domain-containing protein [Pontimonas sp.]
MFALPEIRRLIAGLDARAPVSRVWVAIAAVAGFVAVALVSPQSTQAAWFGGDNPDSQTVVSVGVETPIEREDLTVTAGYSNLPSVGNPEVGSAQAIAAGLVSDAGWSEGEYRCLVALWQRESGWNHRAENPSSGAYGIPQALPANKMATAGEDWASNPETQIRWGIGYISARYGTPCEAWGHSERRGWY